MGLARAPSPSIERAVAANAPIAIVGILIAMIVLLPEISAALLALTFVVGVITLGSGGPT